MGKYIAITSQQIVDVYDLTKKGKKGTEISEITKVSGPSTVYHRLNDYIRSYPDYNGTNYRSSNYIGATTIIKSRKQSTSKIDATPEVVENGKQTDPYSLLQYAYDNFQRELVKFIDYQVNRQVKDTKEELEKLRKENLELQEMKSAMKDSNWLNNLKNKYERDSL